MSSSATPFSRGHHATRRFNNVARLKMANHHPVGTTSGSSSDINNNNSNNNSSNAAAVVAHYEHGHADSLLEALNDLRLSKQLCDIIIVVDQHEYPCHKVSRTAYAEEFSARSRREKAESMYERSPRSVCALQCRRLTFASPRNLISSSLYVYDQRVTATYIHT